MELKQVPLKKRPVDIALVVFFAINFLLVTYMIDIEQLLIADPGNFQYPAWPPRWMVDLVHWYGKNFDPVLMARPAWWRATIWIDSLFFGPFYLVAMYAFIKGKNWIRLVAIVWASVMLTNVTIILFEEINGQYATPELGRVLMANAAWLIFPVIVLYRMWRSVHPFSMEVKE